MENMKDVVKVAVDAYHGNVAKYSVNDSMELLRSAMVEANNGSTIMNYKDIRDGKCVGLFSLVEEILSRTVVDGLQNDDFFMSQVEFRNVAQGDSPLFTVEDDNQVFVVDEIAEGTQGLRRQRLGGSTQTQIPTRLYGARIYEEMNRVMSGAVDFNKLIAKVGDAFRQKLLNEIYALWSSATATDFGGAAYFPVAGTYDEDALLELVSHVEAAAGGKTATIIGTKAALRTIQPTTLADEYKSDLYNMGYYGKWNGVNCVAIPQRHKLGTTDFVYDNKTLTIVAGDQKPIKVVREGNPLLIMGDPMKNADLTYEYMYTERWGSGLILAGNSGIGRYKMT